MEISENDTVDDQKKQDEMKSPDERDTPDDVNSIENNFAQDLAQQELEDSGGLRRRIKHEGGTEHSENEAEDSSVDSEDDNLADQREILDDSQLSQRNHTNSQPNEELIEDEDEDSPKNNHGSPEKKLVGKTEDGVKFILPETKNPLTLHPIKEWSVFEWLKNASILNVLLLTFGLPRWFYIALFLFWRFAYNLGLGWLLAKQSKDQSITKVFCKIDKSHPAYPLVSWALKLGMGNDYSYDQYPAAFNAWLAFRYLVDIILANDLMCYFVFTLACFEWPERFSLLVVVSYVVGALLIAFTLWAKTDAYRVVKDFAWYWGDFFFLVEQKLTFDRVFSISPHPMYTIGYTFFYGASLITQSFTVLYVSLFAHFCQLAFLSLVENPHIKKTYPDWVEDTEKERSKILYDAQTGYFRRDLIVFKNFDIFRSSDLFMLVIIIYCLIFNFIDLPAYFYVAQAIIWRVIHSGVLGYVMSAQSKHNFWTNHFVQLGYTRQYAFENWKRIFNLSLVMTNLVFYSCVYKLANDLTIESLLSGYSLFRITVGLILIAVNVWSSVSTFEVLGDFGWFYGDFFIDEVPAILYYTGIFRFINNPDSVTGFAGYYGLALISNSWTVFALAVFAHGCNELFIRYVEEPHMKKLYGHKVRGKSGIEMAISQIVNEAVEKNPNLKMVAKSASELNLKAREEAKRIKRQVSEKALNLKVKAQDEVSKFKDKVTGANGRFPC